MNNNKIKNLFVADTFLHLLVVVSLLVRLTWYPVLASSDALSLFSLKKYLNFSHPGVPVNCQLLATSGLVFYIDFDIHALNRCFYPKRGSTTRDLWFLWESEPGLCDV